MALKMFLLLYQEFGAAFQEVTKNLVLKTDLLQKLNFGIQKTAHTSFAKITSVKKFIHTRGYHSLVDASVIWRACSRTANQNSVFSEMPFIGRLSLMETIQLICISGRLIAFPVIRPFGERYSG